MADQDFTNATNGTERVLERVAAQLALRMAEQALTHSALYLRSGGRVHRDTISNILRAHDCKVSTLAELAEALGCRMSIRIDRPSGVRSAE